MAEFNDKLLACYHLMQEKRTQWRQLINTKSDMLAHGETMRKKSECTYVYAHVK